MQQIGQLPSHADLVLLWRSLAELAPGYVLDNNTLNLEYCALHKIVYVVLYYHTHSQFTS